MRDDHDLLQNMVEKVVAASHPEKIILFGSYARKDWHMESDLDLLIVEKK